MVRHLTLTPVDVALMEAVGDFWALHRHAPSYRDLIGAFATLNSSSSVKYHLDTLVKIKLLRRSSARLRSLSLMPAAFRHLKSTAIVTRLTLPLPDRLTVGATSPGNGLRLSDYGRIFTNAVRVAAEPQIAHLSEPLKGALVCSARLYVPESLSLQAATTCEAMLIGLQETAISRAAQVREQYIYLEDAKGAPRIEVELWKVWP